METITKKNIVLFIIGIVIVYFLYQYYKNVQSIEPEHWTDQQLIENFNKYRSDFEDLCSIALSEKGSFTVRSDSVVLEKNTLSDYRIDKYRKYIKTLQLNGGVSSSGLHKSATFVSTYGGWFSHQSDKGYVCVGDKNLIDEINHNLYGSLDEMSIKLKGDGYRHIEGNWYLYFSGY